MWDTAAWEALLRSFLLFLPRVLGGLILFLVLWLIGTALQRVVTRAAGNRLDPGLTYFLSRAAKLTFVACGALTALGTLGVDVTALVTGLGLTGFAVGFALKDIISNALSGILILVYKPFRHGDQITVSDQTGKVSEINLRYTVLDAEDKTVFVPNSNLFTNVVIVNKPKESGAPCPTPPDAPPGPPPADAAPFSLASSGPAPDNKRVPADSPPHEGLST
jgi:small conductance mechanosensitive channel